MLDFFLESCCTSVDEVLYAQDHGASRIELCENLTVGGVTPSERFLSEVMAVATVPVNVLVRPREGGFCFSPAEVEKMLSGIDLCKSCGACGVVIGALNQQGNVDIPSMTRMIEAARPLNVTFHRAFDVCWNPMTAFEDILSLGCERLLTSGHEADAYKGRFLIAELVRLSAGKIVVMPGCGVRSSNIEELRCATGASEYHASSRFWNN